MSDSSSSAPVAPAAPIAAAADVKAPAAPAAAPQAQKGSLQSAADAVDSKKAPAAIEGEGGEPETKAEKKARLLKLKVDGREEDYDIDNTPDDVIARDLQLSKAARVRMQEAAEIQKKFREAVEFGKQNPVDALRDVFGVQDPKAFMEEYLTKVYGEEAKKATMSPEQLELEQLKAEKAQWEAAKKAEQEAKQSQAREALNARVLEETRATFAEALEKAGLPKNQKTMFELARVMKWNLEHGIKLTPAQLAQEVKQEFSGGLKQIVGALDGDSLLAELGDDVVKKVIQARLAKSKVSPVPVVPKAVQAAPVEDDEVPPGTPIHLRRMFRK